MTTGKRLVLYALQVKKWMIGGIILLIIAVIADLLGPIVVKELIDNYIAQPTIEVQPVVKLLTIFFGLAIVTAVLRYFQYIFMQRGANAIILKMRNELYSHVQTLPIRYFDNLPAGKIVARITNDTEAIRQLYVTVVSQFVISGTYMIGIYIALFYLEPKMTAILLILIPLLFLWMLFYRKYASKVNRIIRSKVSEMNAAINESIQGMTIIQAFQREKQIEQEFEEINSSHFTYQNKLLKVDSATSHSLVSVLRTLAFIVFIWYFGGASITSNMAISVGLLYAFVDYITRLFNPITGVVDQFARLEHSLIAAERVFRLLDQKGEPVSDKRMERFNGNVKFDNVSFAYTDEDYVLKNISFEAKQGQTIALVGHTGSGKSTIMNLLFRFYDPTKGTISIDGQSITNMPKQMVREHMGIVLQDPYLFSGTIESNIRFANDNISREKVREALLAVGGERILQYVEKDIDEPVVEKGSTLSAGQRQIISFARALAYDPAILLLDEATSNIDTETEEIIQHAMDVVKKGRTTIIIAHRLSTIQHADQILVLERGQIIERGTHQQLLDDNGQYAQMYRLQAKNSAQ